MKTFHVQIREALQRLEAINEDLPSTRVYSGQDMVGDSSPYEKNLQAALEIAKASEQRAWNVVKTIREARVREVAAIQAMQTALRDALPFLVQLGDYIGNGNANGGLGERCDMILRAKDALRAFEATLL